MRYFVSYAFIDKYGRSGFGNTTIISKEKITSPEDIRETEKVIASMMGRDTSEGNISLLNYILME